MRFDDAGPAGTGHWECCVSDCGAASGVFVSGYDGVGGGVWDRVTRLASGRARCVGRDRQEVALKVKWDDVC